MLTLLHHPFCPHSRFVRLVLAELSLDAEMLEERVWDRRQEFLELNPGGTTPVLVEEGYPAIPGSSVIAEHLDETRGHEMGDRRLMPSDVAGRIETRRLSSWFNEKFFEEVSGPLVSERFYKRHMRIEQGGGPPDTDSIRAARTNIRYHLAYIGWLVGRREWLAGERLSFADLAAAAHLSSVDYLGDVPWGENEHAKVWYSRLKSRPAFRTILSDRVPGLPAAEHYADLDF